jgi:hypothetical protein
MVRPGSSGSFPVVSEYIAKSRIRLVLNDIEDELL